MTGLLSGIDRFVFNLTFHNLKGSAMALARLPIVRYVVVYVVSEEIE